MNTLKTYPRRFWKWARAHLPRPGRFLARLVAAVLAPPEPAGGIVAASGHPIDDGVNYEQPEFRLPQGEPEIELPGHLRGPSLSAELAAERQAYIDQQLTEAGVDFHFQFDTPYTQKPPENLSSPVFAIPLREWTWQARRQVTERAHMAYERNPLAKRAVKITTQFAMGDGLTITYRNDDVERVLEEFRANLENCVEQYEKEFCNDLQVDGELFIRFFASEDGNTVIVPLRPWEIAWVETDMQFIKRVVAYHRQGFLYNGTPGSYQYVVDDIPAREVLHVAINKHAYEQRGRSDLFDILPWLRAYKDWLEDRARQNHWRGALLLDLTLENATPQQIATKRAQLKQPPPPGSMYIHNEKEAMEYKDSKIDASNVAEDGRQIKLMAAVGKGLAEYMLGDGENANLASATAQQLPTLRTFGEYQDINVNQVWWPIYQRAIENAVENGTLTEMVEEHDSEGKVVVDDAGQPKKIKAVDAFDLSAPELESDDPKTLADSLVIAENQEWAAKETASAKAGYDYRVEKRKIKAQKVEAAQELMDMRAQGLEPGPLPGQQPQFNPQDPEAPTAGDSGYGDDMVPAGARGAQLAPQGTNGTKPKYPGGVPESSKGGSSSDVQEPTVRDRLAEALEKVAELRAEPAPAPVVNVNLPDMTEKIKAGVKGLLDDAVTELGSQSAQQAESLTARTDRLAGQMTALDAGVGTLGSDLARMADAGAKHEHDTLAAFNSLMTQLEAQNEAPPQLLVMDEDLIRSIAGQEAVRVVGESQAITNEVTSRDAAGRPAVIRRVLASGATADYRVIRDVQGNTLRLEKE